MRGDVIVDDGDGAAGAVRAPTPPVHLAPFERAARVPLHHQIKDDLALQLRSGRFLPGAALPGEAALSAHYGASRGTLRQALGELARDGLIERHPGRGSFLRGPKIEGSVVGSSRRFRMEGPPLDPGGTVLRLTRRRAPAAVARILDLGDERAVHVLERVRTTRGTPVTLQTSYLPVALCPDLARHDLAQRHLIDILQTEYGVSFTSAEEFVEPGIADAYVARHLALVTGTPVFEIERRTYLPDGKVGEYRRAVMRGDVYRYRIELR